MSRRTHIWAAFAVSVAAALVALGWVSLTALGLERSEARMRRQTAIEEKVRLALWHMDSALAPLIAQENARPYFSYTAFHPAERAYTRMYTPIEPGEVLVPSPLLTEIPRHVLLHFQYDESGNLTSPQVPTGNMRDLAEARGYVTHEAVGTRAERLAELQESINQDALLSALRRKAPPSVDLAQLREAIEETRGGKVSQDEIERSNLEWERRQRYAQQAAVPQAVVREPAPPPADEGIMRAVWIGQALVLARHRTVDGREYIQGCWLDWPALKRWLLDGEKDLLPEAELEPVRTHAAEGPLRRLAALPVELHPGAVSVDVASRLSAIRIALVIAWVCVLGAAAMMALLLWGTVSLSERRGTFVSAVTHELRTPLTTFRMYTEMLADNILQGEEKRQSYLNTLRAEADRLGHLVENVLAYARLDGGRFGERFEPVALNELLERASERLAERAKRADLTLVVNGIDAAEPIRLCVDTAAVEQILFNLVDNACKYATATANRTIEIHVAHEDNRVALRVCDHGPGLSEQAARRLFRAFAKSARDAAHSAPGLGLGLALSRRLARKMGGDLQLERSTKDGACFTLTLPIG